MSKTPIAVLISDIHYNLNTLEIADKCLNMALSKSKDLDVPLIIAGDLHDTKANIRGECIKKIRKTLDKGDPREIFILIGNHDKINEKSNDNSLYFLKGHAYLVDTPMELRGFNFIPYQHDPKEMKTILSEIEKGSLIIMHQGVKNANSGDYFNDKSAIDISCLADFRVISGHYHSRQDINTLTYIGNPYTLTFGEAKDPKKGFLILYEDRSTEVIYTNMREHKIFEVDFKTLSPQKVKEDDLVWVKCKVDLEDKEKATKEYISKKLNINNFRLNLITENINEINKKSSIPFNELLDSNIDSLIEDKEKQNEIKDMWKSWL